MKAVLLNRILLILGFVGVFIAGFLSLAHILGGDVPCGVGGGCNQVTKDPSGSWFGIPVAFFGLGAYLALTALAAIRATRGLGRTKNLITPGFVLALLGTALSLYLQYVALFQIRQRCDWCLASAATMILTLFVYAMLAQKADTIPEDSRDPIGFQATTGLAAVALVALAISGFTLKGQAASVGQPPAVALNDEVELIPEGANTFGSADAPITIVEFADMYCGSCRTNTPRLKEFAQQYPGKIRVVYRHFPLIRLHELAVPAALLAEAAAEKGRFWDYTVAVMSSEKAPESLDELLEIAGRVGLDVKSLRTRLEDDKDPIYQRLQRDMQAADLLGLQATPTFIILTEDGKKKEVTVAGSLWEVLQKKEYQEILEGNAAAA